MTVTSLQLHCCPLLLNLNGFDLALQIVFVCFSLPGQRGRTFVRCRACRIHKQLHGKKGSQTEDRGSGGGGSSAAGGGGGGSGSPAAGGGAEAEARKQAQVVVEAKAKAAARQQALMEATTAAPRQRAEAMEAAEAEARQQAQVVAEAKVKAATLQ